MKQFFKYLFKQKFKISLSCNRKPRINDRVLYYEFRALLLRHFPEGGTFVKVEKFSDGDISLSHLCDTNRFLVTMPNKIETRKVRVCETYIEEYELANTETHFKKIK